MKKREKPGSGQRPVPQDDWINQHALAELLSVCPRTVGNWDAAGKLAQFEHGFPSCGRRRFSRRLVERALQRRWAEAIRRQDAMLGHAEAKTD